VIIVKPQFDNFTAISWRGQVTLNEVMSA